MRLTHTVEARLQQTQRIDPRQILASEMLTWTTAELEAAVERELAENPALEAKEPETEPAVETRATLSERDLRMPMARGGDEGDEDDPMDRVASSLSLREKRMSGRTVPQPLRGRLSQDCRNIPPG